MSEKEKFKKIKLNTEDDVIEVAKNFLNNFYGKTASSYNTSFKVEYYDEETDTIKYYIVPRIELKNVLERYMKKLAEMELEINALQETLDKLVTSHETEVETYEFIINTKNRIIEIKDSIIKSQETRIKLLEINLGFLP